MQVRGNDPLQILEHACPRKCLALNQSIHELRLVSRAAVGDQVKEGLRLCPFRITCRDLLLQARDVMAISSSFGPAIHRQAQQDESQRAQQAHSESPARPEFTGIFIRPGREIDIETHIYEIQKLQIKHTKSSARKSVLPPRRPCASAEPSPWWTRSVTLRSVPQRGRPTGFSAPTPRHPLPADPPHTRAQCSAYRCPGKTLPRDRLLPPVDRR